MKSPEFFTPFIILQILNRNSSERFKSPLGHYDSMQGIQIDTEKKEVHIFINSSIYSEEAVLRAASEFLSDSWITVDKKDGNFLIDLKPKNETEDVKELAYNFLDFLIVYQRSLKGDSLEI